MQIMAKKNTGSGFLPGKHPSFEKKEMRQIITIQLL